MLTDLNFDVNRRTFFGTGILFSDDSRILLSLKHAHFGANPVFNIIQSPVPGGFDMSWGDETGYDTTSGLLYAYLCVGCPCNSPFIGPTLVGTLVRDPVVGCDPSVECPLDLLYFG